MVGRAKSFIAHPLQGGPMRVSTPMRAPAVPAVLVLAPAAWGGGVGEEGPPSGWAEPTGADGGEYIAEVTEPSSLAPASNCYESECSAIPDVVNDPLVTTDFESGELIFDGVAESIESNEDQSVWT